jgi:zinc protease
MKYRVLVASLLLASSAPLLADQPLLKQPGRWAQDYTGRKADPAVRFGTLPNGLRYAIQHNETPSDGVSMRMRIGSGSLEERDDEQGLAHFIEHMAFRGSTNIADGEVVHMLERQGLQFGPDTNAFTGQDETVYMFNFPRADATALKTGLTLFREIGERLTLARAAIEAEKGVVLSEERLRDTAQYRSAKANLDAILSGTRITKRWPIGTVETIKAADHDRLERFYRANYRPENATIVIVGNVDAAAVEQQLRSAFSDWKPAAVPADTVDYGVPAPAKPVREFVTPGAADELSLTWVGPDDHRAQTEAVDRESIVKLIGLAVLNDRLAERALTPGSPFVSARAANVRSLLHSGSITTMTITASPSKWHEAVDSVSAEQRMLLRDGVQPGELNRALTAIRTAIQSKAASASTQTSQAIADEMVREVDSDSLHTSAAQDVAFATPILARVNRAEVDASLKSLFAGQPILFRSAQRGAVGDSQLSAALNTAYSRTLGAEVKQAAVSWPYTSFGKPAAIASTRVDPQLGTTTVEFTNGTRLLVKPTTYEKDKVQVAVSFGNGRAGVSPSLAHALWETRLYPLTGTGKLSLSQITQWAQSNGKIATIALDAGDRAFVLKGTTRPEDLTTQMQLLAAYARDPGFRPEAFEKARSVAPMIGGQIDANAAAVYARGVQGLMVGNDPRFEQLPNWADLTSTASADLAALVREPLSGQADVVMVGDVTVADAIKATEATFAAGETPQVAKLVSAKVSMPTRTDAPFLFLHKGRADQAFYGEYFPLPDYFADPTTSIVAAVAAAVLQARLVDTVREKLGMTYSPQVNANASDELQGAGFLAATIETPEANFAAFHTLLAGQLKDLAATPVSADELARARQPLVEGLRKRQETNAYWLGKLTELTREPRVKEQALEVLGRVSAVSAADVQAFAARYIASRQPLVAISKAASGAQPAAGTGATPGAKK